MNKFIGVFLVVIAAIGVAAYNFDDPTFNQILAADLEDLYVSGEVQLHSRNRRDDQAIANEKCRQRKKKLCCGEAIIDELHNSAKDHKRECFKEVTGKEPRGPPPDFDPFRCDKVDKHRNEMMCVLQCAGQKLNILDKDGSPKDKEFTAYATGIMGKESWLAAIQDKIIASCLTEARNVTSNRGDVSDTESCNSGGVKLAHCLFREIQLACPDDQIKDQKACSKVRERVQKPDFQSFMNKDE